MAAYSFGLLTRSPRWLQEAILAGRTRVRNLLRENYQYRAALKEVCRSQWFSGAELREYQIEHLASVLRYAAAKIPYYQNVLAEYGLSDGRIASPDDLSRLPLLTKQDVVSAGRALVARRTWGLRFKGTTSGSTGLTLTGYRDLRSIRYENAFIARQLEWAGMRRGDRRAWIRGDIVVPPGQGNPPFWRLNRADNMLMLSSFHLAEAHNPAYVAALEHFDPVIIQAYPSSIAFLARYLDGSGRRYRGLNLKGIVTSSETLLPDQRHVIERAFGCRVFDWYGNYERAAAIGTCEQGSYHILSDYGVVELLAMEDGSKEIVGTGFFNSAMPLFRYRTGDAVIPSADGTTCPCGRALPVVQQIVGRVDDYVRTPDGRHIGMMAIIFDWVTGIWEGQIVQEKIDELRIRVVPMGQLTQEMKQDIEAKARSLTGPDMKIIVEAVEEIPRTARGKLRTVVSKL